MTTQKPQEGARARLRREVGKATRSPLRIVVFLLLLVLSAGAAYALAEGKPLADGIWWAAVTATTVGYGDEYPVTPAGRLVFSFLIVGSAYIVSPLVIGHIVLRMLPDPHAFTHEEQQVVLGRLEDSGQALLILAARLGCEDEVRAALDTHPTGLDEQ